MKKCLNCGIELKKRHQIIFCSNQCQLDLKYKKYIDSWKNGKVDGNRGIITRNVSGFLRRFLLEKFNNKCSQCGWNKKHPITKISPLEIDHIDGDAENNNEKNLRLLCPNCHALTPYFRNLNKGKGRDWRKRKYVKN